MARTSNPYTLEERNIVLKWLQLYPDNLLQGFTRAVEELGNNRNVPALRVKYYSTWKHEEDFRAVTTGSREGFTHNVKNTKSVDGEFHEDRALNKVEWLMKQFSHWKGKIDIRKLIEISDPETILRTDIRKM